MFKVCSGCKLEKLEVEFSKNCHTKDGLQNQCKSCRDTYRNTNKEKINASHKTYREANKEAIRSSRSLWYSKNKDSLKPKRKVYYESTKQLKGRFDTPKEVREERRRAYQKSWSKLNKDKKRLYASHRRARRHQATPSWLSVSQLAEIAYIYSLATEITSLTGEEYHVDHILPLQGLTVCGLHVPWNLQILPKDLNLKKSNLLIEPSRFPPEPQGQSWCYPNLP